MSSSQILRPPGQPRSIYRYSGMLPAFSPQCLHITVFSSHTSQRTCCLPAMCSSTMMPTVVLSILLLMGPFACWKQDQRLLLWTLVWGGRNRFQWITLSLLMPVELARAPHRGCPPNSGPVASRVLSMPGSSNSCQHPHYVYLFIVALLPLSHK